MMSEERALMMENERKSICLEKLRYNTFSCTVPF